MDDTTETPSAGAASATSSSEAPSERPSLAALSMTLAGLQAGMMGVLWMLAWLGIDSSWDRRGFWSEENLFSTAFYGDDAIRAGFGTKTMPGLALYLIVYSILGCLFALALRNRLRPGRTFLAGLVFAMGWFYLSFHVLWKSALPFVYLLYADRPMVVGHLIYGACLARFPGYLPELKRETAPVMEGALAGPIAEESALDDMPPALQAGHAGTPSDLESAEAAGDAACATGDSPRDEVASHESPHTSE